jgi:hypothetical protein
MIRQLIFGAGVLLGATFCANHEGDRSERKK